MPRHSALTGVDLHAPESHASTHEPGGADEITSVGQQVSDFHVKKSLPLLRLQDTTSSKEYAFMVNGSTLLFLVNDGTEAVPVWTTIAQMADNKELNLYGEVTFWGGLRLDTAKAELAQMLEVATQDPTDSNYAPFVLEELIEYTGSAHGVVADDWISEDSVTQHEAALTITESQISDLVHDSGSGSVFGMSSTGFDGGDTYFFGYPGANNAGEGLSKSILPFACTIKNLYVILNNPPAGADTVTVTVRKNGAEPVTPVQAIVTGSETTANDITNSTAYAAGDWFTVEAVATGAVSNIGIYLVVEIEKS